MTPNPLYHALAASGYIICITLFFRLLEHFNGATPDSGFEAAGAISLLVFSVACMAYLFFYQPVVLLLENKKENAVTFFLKTLGFFGLFTFIIFLVLLLVL